MYRTEIGERVLREHEGAVFKQMLASLLEWFDPREVSDEGMTAFGIPIFDGMSYGQKLWSLHLVASALLDQSVPCPPLHAYVEATVATVFAQADVLLDTEKDAPEIGFTARLVAADREAAEDGDLHETTDPQDIVMMLEESILWDTDYLDHANTLDGSPEAVKRVQELMHIPQDYFVEIADDPNDAELRPLFNKLLALVGEETIPIDRITFRVHLQTRGDGLSIVTSRDGIPYVTDGDVYLQPSIKLWSDGATAETLEQLFAGDWSDGSLKPVLESDDAMKLEGGLLTVRAQFTTYTERREFRVVPAKNAKPFLLKDRPRCLIYPSLHWMKADDGDVNAMSATAVDIDNDDLAQRLFEGTLAESREIELTEIAEPIATDE